MVKKKKSRQQHLNGAAKPFSALTEEAVDNYLKSLNGDCPSALYDLVIGEVERPLLRSVMNFTGGNQSRAAEVLGINRGTLRKKLIEHSLISN